MDEAREPLIAPTSNGDLIDHGDVGSGLRRMFNPRLLGVMLLWLLTGSCTAAAGVFIAPIKKNYELSDGQAASIFAAGTCGYLCATSILDRVVARGWRTLAMLSVFFAAIGATVLSTAPPFPLVLASYAVLMFGLGSGDSGFNVWASRAPHPHIVQGFIHSSFSVGCIAGPFVAAQLLSHGWHLFYRLMIVCFSLCGMWLWFAFQSPTERSSEYLVSTARMDHSPRLLQTLQLLPVWMCAVFYLFYVGTEAIFTDWGPEYMTRVKQLPVQQSPLASSLFWLGMATGRLVLGFVTQKIGLRTVTVYLTVALGLQNLLRVDDPSVCLGAIFSIGFFLGPTFPSGILVLTNAVPRSFSANAVAIAAAVGQIGGAITPVSLGFLSDRVGLSHLPDVSLICSCATMVLWVSLFWQPSRSKREYDPDENESFEP
ncbi:MFS transporter-like protein 38 [Elsinoe australis]|uniref:MFS transporter-like protein 38 n=1 Tax=Elsinoe australis TaxID=40998 RepID=A0A4U7BAZ1_9PEZI|nr:MFS transporter-like protein 38 [Elsinoe australis]